MEALVGQRIRGYELRERIGAGGFGEVYRAYQPEVDREVAIKVILPEYVNRPEFIRRFEVEAHVIARLEHIHIVPLYDYWREPNGAYLVMRYLPWSLRKSLRNGRPSLTNTATWVDQIASGLAAAHRNGIIHRDLKPDNILLDAENNAYLADFGIAKVLTGANIADSEPLDGLMGTVHYISPEQIRDGQITPQTDIYALGILIYEMLAGAPPFSGAPEQVLERQLYERLPSITIQRADLSEQIDAIIRHATIKEPEHRYPDIATLRKEFLEAVRQIDGGPVTLSAASETADVIHQIEGDDEPTLAMEKTGITPDSARINPYKGLRAFNEADAFDFFGRANLIKRLIDRLAASVDDARLLAVVGPSGSGKTSVVLAGVVPAIRRGTIPGSNRWFEIEMTPGANPIEKLEAALLSVAVDRLPNVADQLRADRNGLVNVVKQILPPQADEPQPLLIVIDQFEDLFIQVDDESSVAHFLALIYTAVTTPGSPIFVILTLRADFYDKPLLYPEFGELLRKQTEVVLPLTPVELTEAIIKPAARVGVALQPQLITAIIQDVSAQPGALPLLQYALTELYDRLSGRMLTLESYLATGGVIGALAKRADELFNGLDAEGQELAEQLFLRLVLIGEGADDTRRRVNQTELITITRDTIRLRKIIDVFAEYSLLTIDTDPITRLPSVEIAHEALIRSWDKLQQWLVASREDLTLQRSLALTAAEWARNAYNPDYLAVGTRLEQFKDLAQKGHVALSESERLLLDKSVARQEEMEAQAEVALQRKLELGQRAAHLALRADSAQMVAANRLRYLVGVLLVFLIVATGLLLIAVRAAQREAGAARFEESLRFAAEAVNQARATNGELATLLALRSLNRVYTPQGDAALQLALGVNFTVRLFAPSAIGKQDAALSPDAQTVATASRGPSPVISLYAARTGQRLKAFPGAPARMTRISYAHNSTALLTVNTDGTVSIWDTDAAIERAHLTVAAVTSAAFSADDQYVLTASGDGTATLWDARTGKQVTRYSGHREGVESAVFSPDGRYVLTASLDGEARVFDRETGQLRYEFVPPGTGERLHSAVFSPNGNYIAAGGYNELVYLWDIASYRLVRTLEGHTDEILSVAFAPDGQSIASAGLDLDPILWDATTGMVIRRFIGHDDTVNHVSFSADGALLLTSADNGVVRLWNTGDRPETSADFLRLLKGHMDTVYYAAYSPQGDRIASASKDGTVRIWDAASGVETQHYAGSARIWWLAFAPDGQTLVAAGDDGIAQVLDVKTGLVLQSFRQAGTIWTAAFAPDGVRVITGGLDGIGHIWDVRSGQELVALRGHTDKIYGAAFAPDGKTVVTVSTDKTAILWDAASGAPIRTFTGHTDQIFAVAFSHDGKSIATASRDKTARLWDVGTGAEKWAILGHHDVVWTVQFSSDDKSLLTAGADGTARLWDIATGNEVRRITGHTNAVTSAAFSPDDAWVLTTSYDQTIRLTRSSYLALTSTACNRLVRDFSGGERLAFGIQDAVETCATRR